ncbi:hypothetical protein T06_7962 [Trichinella sp. T6]|nr:hypothetical protein T06_7962 [Trichinella sp. T6]
MQKVVYVYGNLLLNIRVGYRRRRFGGRDDVISKELCLLFPELKGY